LARGACYKKKQATKKPHAVKVHHAAPDLEPQSQVFSLIKEVYSLMEALYR